VAFIDKYRNELPEMTALRTGRQWSPPDSAMSRLASAAAHDADVFRAFFETLSCLALTQELIQRPGIEDAMERLGHTAPAGALGPDRQQLFQLLSA
jgi:hypothetical protein